MPRSFTDRAVPILKEAPTTAQSRSVPIDLTDPRAKEPLCEIRDVGIRGENFYARDDGLNLPYAQRLEGSIPDLLLRQGVAERLLEADHVLSACGLALFVLDGYRPISTQLGIWRYFWDRFASENPNASEVELEAKVRTFVSDPRQFDPGNAQWCPLHATGGAVDVRLVDRSTGNELEMGAPFDDATPASATDHFEHLREKGFIEPDDPRLLHRRMLYWSLRDAGFTNYPHEYWHYDWGNQMHVLMLGVLGELVPPAAWYGYVPLQLT